MHGLLCSQKAASKAGLSVTCFAGILHIPAMRVVFNIRFTGEAYIGT
jgi:hypothetical protein